MLYQGAFRSPSFQLAWKAPVLRRCKQLLWRMAELLEVKQEVLQEERVSERYATNCVTTTRVSQNICGKLRHQLVVRVSETFKAKYKASVTYSS